MLEFLNTWCVYWFIGWNWNKEESQTVYFALILFPSLSSHKSIKSSLYPYSFSNPHQESRYLQCLYCLKQFISYQSCSRLCLVICLGLELAITIFIQQSASGIWVPAMSLLFTSTNISRKIIKQKVPKSNMHLINIIIIIEMRHCTCNDINLQSSIFVCVGSSSEGGKLQKQTY